MKLTTQSLIIASLVATLSCVQNGAHKQGAPREDYPPAVIPAPLADTVGKKLPLTTRVFTAKPLSTNAMNVLKAAFETDYAATEDKANAYDFVLHQGQKGMDWWNFPWDLPSSQVQYQITFQDMADMLENVTVRKQKQADTLISYAEMLAFMVEQLTPDIMNAHGGYLRVVKIIYCVRNFLAVAVTHNRKDDIAHLKRAAKKIIALYETKKLVTGSSPYLKGSQFNPRDINGNTEDRTDQNGIAALKALLQ